MLELETMQVVPLTQSEDGSIRISGSRVTFDSIIEEYKRGATPEQILVDFPSLTLPAIYGAITYYLTHTVDVEDYLRARKAESQRVRELIEGRQDLEPLRNRLQKQRSSGGQ